MADSEVIAGLGTRAGYISAIPGALERELSAEEKALVTCIGAGAQIRDVIVQSKLPESKAIVLLLGLRLKGVVHPVTKAPAPKLGRGSPVPMEASRASGSLDTAALAETVDLDDARKREILELEARLKRDHYFALLGVPAGASPGDCKKAYYELTKRFHPDRYYGKKLGTYKDRIDAIFKRLTEVQGVLSEVEKRKAYLAQHPELDRAPPAMAARQESAAHGRSAAGPDTETAVDRDLAERRSVERRARFARHPYLAKQGKLHELLSRGREDLEKQDFAKAYTDLSLAAKIDPKNHEVAVLLAKAKAAGDKERAAAELQEAAAAESAGDMASALVHMRTAVGLDPENAGYALKAARLLLAAGGEHELKEAHNFARKASELAPNNVEHHLVFAKVLARIGLDRNAVREYELVLKLDAGNAAAKEQLKKLKRII